MSKFTSKFAQLLGVARVRQSETGAREALNEELVRQLTEGEPVEVRPVPSRHVIAVFPPPDEGARDDAIDACDDGEWREIRVKPCVFSTPGSEES